MWIPEVFPAVHPADPRIKDASAFRKDLAQNVETMLEEEPQLKSTYRRGTDKPPPPSAGVCVDSVSIPTLVVHPAVLSHCRRRLGLRRLGARPSAAVFLP